MAHELSERELNRALLARQGLLEPLALPAGRLVATVGALQMQHWPSLRPAMWSRMSYCPPHEPYRAHADGELLTGTLLRGTIHTVPTPLYPAYAAVAGASRPTRWWRGRTSPGPAAQDLRRELLAFAGQPRTAQELTDQVEAWVARHPGALPDEEIAAQRLIRWRPLVTSVGFVRVPAQGRWDARTPRLLQAAPVPPLPDPDPALDEVVGCHLRAFGPAAAEDVAWWIGWPVTPVRAALARLPGLVTFTDGSGRTLHDHPDSPRPPADTAAPVRLLPPYDSAVLAYAPPHRIRILPAAHRDAVFVKANGQFRATLLVDGFVAGTWTMRATGGRVTLALTSLTRLSARSRAAARAQAERLLTGLHPEARAHEIALE